MKRMLTLAAILMAVGMSASLAVADMNSSRVPPKGRTSAPKWSPKAWRARMSVTRRLPRSRISKGLLPGKAPAISGVVCERRGHPRRSCCSCVLSEWAVPSCQTSSTDPARRCRGVGPPNGGHSRFRCVPFMQRPLAPWWAPRSLRSDTAPVGSASGIDATLV